MALENAGATKRQHIVLDEKLQSMTMKVL